MSEAGVHPHSPVQLLVSAAFLPTVVLSSGEGLFLLRSKGSGLFAAA